MVEDGEGVRYWVEDALGPLAFVIFIGMAFVTIVPLVAACSALIFLIAVDLKLRAWFRRTGRTDQYRVDIKDTVFLAAFNFLGFWMVRRIAAKEAWIWLTPEGLDLGMVIQGALAATVLVGFGLWSPEKVDDSARDSAIVRSTASTMGSSSFKFTIVIALLFAIALRHFSDSWRLAVSMPAILVAAVILGIQLRDLFRHARALAREQQLSDGQAVAGIEFESRLDSK